MKQALLFTFIFLASIVYGQEKPVVVENNGLNLEFQCANQLQTALEQYPDLERIKLHHCGDSLDFGILAGFKSLKKLHLEFQYNKPFELSEQMSELSQLEELTIRGGNLESWPEVFAGMSKLKKLNLTTIRGFSKLPSSIGQLTQLEELYIDNCLGIDTLPKAIGNLKNLKKLELVNLTYLSHIPDELGQLSKLETFTTIQLNKLFSFPSTIAQLKNLKNFRIDIALNIDSLDSDIGALTQLESLTIRPGLYMEALPASFGQLTNLKSFEIRESHNIKDLPKEMGNIKSLEYLTIYDCGKMTKAPTAMDSFINLKELSIIKCSSIETLPKSIGNMQQLEKITLMNNGRLDTLPGEFSELFSLRELIIKASNPKIIQGVDFSEMESLEKAYFQGKYFNLEAMPPGLAILPNLRELAFNFSGGDYYFETGTFTKLKKLIAGTDANSRIDGISNLLNLEHYVLNRKRINLDAELD